MTAYDVEQAGECSMSTMTLEPCPFCGTNDHETSPWRSGRYHESWICNCGNPSCGVRIEAPTPEDAVARWNRRAHLAQPAQATTCAGCGEHKATPLRIDAMGGYVCLTCIDQKLSSLLGEFGYPESQSAQAVDGWRPIETAPKDGTAILIADIQDGVVYDVLNGHFEVLAEDEDDGPWDIRDGEPWCSYEGRGAGIYFCHWLPGKEWESRWLFGHDSGYTHWMPLPASPAPDKEGA